MNAALLQFLESALYWGRPSFSGLAWVGPIAYCPHRLQTEFL